MFIFIPIGLISSLCRSSRRSQPSYRVFQNPGVTNGVPAVTQTAPCPPDVPISDRWAARKAEVLGSLQVFTGVMSILFGAIAIAMEASGAYSGAGIWCGTLYMIAGMLALLSGKYKTHTFITLTAVLGWIAVCAGLIALFCSGIGLMKDSDVGKDRDFYKYGEYGFLRTTTTTPAYENLYDRNGKIAVNAVILGCAVVEGILAMWLAIIACNATCSYRSAGRVNSPADQTVSVTGGQGYSYNQPVYPQYSQNIYSVPQVTTIQQPVMQNLAASPPAYQPTAAHRSINYGYGFSNA